MSFGTPNVFSQSDVHTSLPRAITSLPARSQINKDLSGRVENSCLRGNLHVPHNGMLPQPRAKSPLSCHAVTQTLR